jgi:hypothetical protein
MLVFGTASWHLNRPEIFLDGQAADVVQIDKVKSVDLRSSGQD